MNEVRIEELERERDEANRNYGYYLEQFKLFRGKVSSAEAERDQLKQKLADAVKALEKVQKATNAHDPESYGADDREGCLDYVFHQAETALKSLKGETA
jgi:phage-related minor tail protein